MYAALETQSIHTFEDQEVCEKIGSGLEPVKVKLSGLRVRGFSSQSFINSPPAYTRDFIPLECSHILKVHRSHLDKELAQIQEESERQRGRRANSRE